MNKTFFIAASIATVFAATNASATCFTTGNFTNCSDGNSYSTIGNTTFGSNSKTGSPWSQTTIGNQTIGTASNGNSWSSFNNGTSSFGTDSRGNSWSCVGLFCN